MLAGCLLNYHKDVRTRATLWIPFTGMSVYDNTPAPDSLGLHYNSHPAC